MISVTTAAPSRGASPDWRTLFLSALPALEYAAAHPEVVGEKEAEDARRALVRYYLVSSAGPGLAKTRVSAP